MSNGLFTLEESVRMLPHHPATSESAAKAKLAVRAAFADALFVRPAVMFGLDDAFLTTILKLLRQLPIYPMLGRGPFKLQPAYVEDVAAAVAHSHAASRDASDNLRVRRPTRLLLRAISQSRCGSSWSYAPAGSNPVCRLARTGMGLRMLPGPPLTRNQVELMQIDTVSSPEMPGFIELGISPHSVEAILQRMLSNCG